VAKHRIFDLLQTHRFWLFDVATYSQSPIGGVFDPALGFVSATAPKISGNVKEIKPGNSPYTHHFLQSATCAPIVLTRGARWWDSDFYRWLTKFLEGETDARRTVVLVHLLGQRTLPARPGRTDEYTGVASDAFATNVPARAWVLRDCIPSDYESGADFQSKNAEVSVATLTIHPHSFDEVSVATLTPTIARLFSLSYGVYDSVAELLE